jgi:hypothetical protein
VAETGIAYNRHMHATTMKTMLVRSHDSHHLIDMLSQIISVGDTLTIRYAIYIRV